MQVTGAQVPAKVPGKQPGRPTGLARTDPQSGSFDPACARRCAYFCSPQNSFPRLYLAGLLLHCVPERGVIAGPLPAQPMHGGGGEIQLGTRALTDAIISARPALASAKNMPVFGSVYSSLSIPA